MLTSREIHLASRPSGWPAPENFTLVQTPVPDPADGQVVVRNRFLSVDPYMRGRMSAAKSYVAPFEVGQAMDGGAVGEVIASRSERLDVGDLVLHGLGWREVAVLDAAGARRVEPVPGLPLSVYLGVLGMPGLTAYVGLLDIAAMQPGDAVFVSGAAGAVGSTVGQIAKARGAARVVGSAGSSAKVTHLTDVLGFDAAFSYRDGDVASLLKNAAPEGIDVYFDNVGGDHLEAAIARLRTHGRIAACGAISAYNATEPPTAPRNLSLVVGKRLTIRGFIVSDHAARMPEFVREMTGWLREGRVLVEETVAEGIEHAAEAFLGMLRGENTGKMIVKLDTA